MRAGICDENFNWQTFEFVSDVKWMRDAGVRGMVLGHRILFADIPSQIPQRTFRHELQHAYQIMRHGRLRFYVKFFLYSLRHGYHRNPFEEEARAHECDPLTAHEEKLLWNLRSA